MTYIAVRTDTAVKLCMFRLLGVKVQTGSTKLSGAERLTAFVLAGIWVAAGLTAIYCGVRLHRWALAVPGFAGLWYGILWVLVTCRGRRLHWTEALRPWRRP